MSQRGWRICDCDFVIEVEHWKLQRTLTIWIKWWRSFWELREVFKISFVWYLIWIRKRRLQLNIVSWRSCKSLKQIDLEKCIAHASKIMSLISKSSIPSPTLRK
jgi:hypothetical protein